MDTPDHIRLGAPADGLHLAIGEQTTLSDGTPVRRFKRYGVKVGETYKKKGWKTPLVVTEDRAARWLSNWQAMKANGVPVKVSKDHRNFTLAENTMGDVVDVVREGPWLAFIHDVRGQENIRIAEANKDVSVEIYPRFTDGKSRTYEDVIPCITYTPIPVVTDQPIAASLADDDGVYVLSTEEPTMPDMTTLYCSIAKLAGVKPEEVTEKNAQTHLDKHLETCASLKMSLAEVEKDRDAFKARLAEAEGQVKKLSTGTEPDTKYLSLSARIIESAINGSKRLNQAQKKDAIALFVGDRAAAKFSPLMLSLHEDDAAANLVEKLVGIIDGGEAPPKPGETTPAQGIRLSRDVPDADDAPKEPAYGWGKVFGKQAEPTAAAK